MAALEGGLASLAAAAASAQAALAEATNKGEQPSATLIRNLLHPTEGDC